MYQLSNLINSKWTSLIMQKFSTLRLVRGPLRPIKVDENGESIPDIITLAKEQ